MFILSQKGNMLVNMNNVTVYYAGPNITIETASGRTHDIGTYPSGNVKEVFDHIVRCLEIGQAFFKMP